jgi:hypothetical protein
MWLNDSASREVRHPIRCSYRLHKYTQRSIKGDKKKGAALIYLIMEIAGPLPKNARNEVSVFKSKTNGLISKIFFPSAIYPAAHLSCIKKKVQCDDVKTHGKHDRVIKRGCGRPLRGMSQRSSIENP